MLGDKILITGACGYIGGSLAIKLKQEGHYIIGCDLVKKDYLMEYMDEFHQKSFDDVLLDDVDIIIHCAAVSEVGPSVKNPSIYYRNNVIRTLNMLDNIRPMRRKVPVIFSSSASVYGNIKKDLLYENFPLNPISPYAISKYTIEKVLESYGNAYDMPYLIFRYFNVCGAIGCEHGQEPGVGHIFSKLMNCIRNDLIFNINGSSYQTHDGTCVRDYIHISDVVNVYKLTLKDEFSKYNGRVINIGTGNGMSIYDCIDVIETYFNKKVKFDISSKRIGDTDSLVADISRLKLCYPNFTHDVNSNGNNIVKTLDRWYTSENYQSII